MGTKFSFFFAPGTKTFLHRKTGSAEAGLSNRNNTTRNIISQKVEFFFFSAFMVDLDSEVCPTKYPAFIKNTTWKW